MDVELMMWARDGRLRYRSAWGRTVAAHQQKVVADPKNAGEQGKMEGPRRPLATAPGRDRISSEEIR